MTKQHHTIVPAEPFVPKTPQEFRDAAIGHLTMKMGSILDQFRVTMNQLQSLCASQGHPPDDSEFEKKFRKLTDRKLARSK